MTIEDREGWSSFGHRRCFFFFSGNLVCVSVSVYLHGSTQRNQANSEQTGRKEKEMCNTYCLNR